MENKKFEEWSKQFSHLFDDRIIQELYFKDEAYSMYQAAQPQWLPIETAPKDGTKIILYVKDFYLGEGYFHSRFGWCADLFLNTRQVLSNVTHWQPLPPPPKD